MKKIIGLDLGTNSVGWALVKQAEKEDEKNSIIKLGVRSIPLTIDEQNNYETGKSITTNADRAQKKGARKNLSRYKERRTVLINTLKEKKFISEQDILTEKGNETTFQTLRLRAKAATEKISLTEFARVLLNINKKRGYKSNRKSKTTEETGCLIDGIQVATYLYDNNLTPGEYSLSLLEKGKKKLPDYYKSDLQKEFDTIWNYQKQFHTNKLTDELKEELSGRNEKQTFAILKNAWGIEGIKREGKPTDQQRQEYNWRKRALSQELEIERLSIILGKINGFICNSSGYLGAISDRSKCLYINKQTVGQYQMAQLDKNPHFSLKNQIYYRQDYLDEFEKIWETQAEFYPKELTDDLKTELRDIIIFYQRRLKSKKGLISFCELESKPITIIKNGVEIHKTQGLRVIPKSSPLFQEFRIWQVLNNITITDTEENSNRPLTKDEKKALANELSIKESISDAEALKTIKKDKNQYKLNYKEIKGNRTNSELFKAFNQIVELSGHDIKSQSTNEQITATTEIFEGLQINTKILSFNDSLKGDDLLKQDYYHLWHLLYSYEGDKSKTGEESLIKKIEKLCNMDEEYASILAKVTFEDDYGNLSAKAIRKILPFMKEGECYSDACASAGYNHSKRSLTKEELENKTYKDELEILPKNSLRNPVVEKILNQTINVVNEIIKEYGKPDEIHVEMARELKMSQEERVNKTKSIAENTAVNEKLKKEIEENFGIKNPSKKDLEKYKLWKEYDRGMYSDRHISNPFDACVTIEHIIPKAKLFDDSYSNKTLEFIDENIDKSDQTAYDFVESKYGKEKAMEYKEKVERLLKNKKISKTKHDKLLMKEEDIPSDFIERDLKDTQYIAKKTIELLEEITPHVVTTTGSITKRLREDWQIVDVLKELDMPKYDAANLTTIDENGKKQIIGWTKRNDQRHHAMDALAIAFTKHSYIQYLNNLNARNVAEINAPTTESGKLDLWNLEKEQIPIAVAYVRKNEMHRDKHNRLLFNAPMPLSEFRCEVKKQMEAILVSYKCKAKVVTKNINKAKNHLERKQITLTPRGKLHDETIYGKISRYETKEETVGSSFNKDKIATVCNLKYRNALLKRLEENQEDAKKAFTGKNSLEKNPIYLSADEKEALPKTVKTVHWCDIYTIRKDISGLSGKKEADVYTFINKVIDVKTRNLLQERYEKAGHDSKVAFGNLEENPIWINKEANICIKRVTIKGLSNAIAIHNKHDEEGKLILDTEGKEIPSDYVSTNNNHHVEFYKDENGKTQDVMVSFFEAVERRRQGLPAVDRFYKQNEGWKFLFSMKQNEYFVFPNTKTGFNPKEIDLNDESYNDQISANLFRLQKMSKVSAGNSDSRDYTFRHHLETTVNTDKELKDITYKRCRNLSFVDEIVKVRINHIGKIVAIGED